VTEDGSFLISAVTLRKSICLIRAHEGTSHLTHSPKYFV